MSEQLTTATPTGSVVRAGELAARLEQANAEVIEFVQACPSALWAARTPEEGWAVPAAAMHIAFGHLTITTWVHRLSAGLPVTETMADFAVVNAADEQKYANASQAEVVESLQTFGDAALRYVRGLTDKELEGDGPVRTGRCRSDRGPARRRRSHRAPDRALREHPGGSWLAHERPVPITGLTLLAWRPRLAVRTRPAPALVAAAAWHRGRVVTEAGLGQHAEVALLPAAWSRCASRGSPWSWPDAFFASESERDCFERDSECHAESLACLAGHDL